MQSPSRPSPCDLKKAAELLEAADPGNPTAKWLLAITDAALLTPKERVEARSRKLHELWMQGKTVYEIAAELGTRVNNVTAWVVRARKDGLCPARLPRTVGRPPTGSVFREVPLPIGLPIFGRYRGEFFWGKVHGGGIAVDGETYQSPSTAAMAAVERRLKVARSLNGWDFWRIQLKDGREALISSIRIDPGLLNQVRDPLPIDDNTSVYLGDGTIVTFASVANMLCLSAERLEALKQELAIRGEGTAADTEGKSRTVIVATSDR